MSRERERERERAIKSSNHRHKRMPCIFNGLRKLLTLAQNFNYKASYMLLCQFRMSIECIVRRSLKSVDTELEIGYQSI